MTDEHQISEDELETVEAEQLPDRQVMTILPISGDPTELAMPPEDQPPVEDRPLPG